jgi:hypothetical protein
MSPRGLSERYDAPSRAVGGDRERRASRDRQAVLRFPITPENQVSSVASIRLKPWLTVVCATWPVGVPDGMMMLDFLNEYLNLTGTPRLRSGVPCVHDHSRPARRSLRRVRTHPGAHSPAGKASALSKPVGPDAEAIVNSRACGVHRYFAFQCSCAPRLRDWHDHTNGTLQARPSRAKGSRAHHHGGARPAHLPVHWFVRYYEAVRDCPRHPGLNRLGSACCSACPVNRGVVWARSLVR